VIVKRILRKYGYPPDKQEKQLKPYWCVGTGRGALQVVDCGMQVTIGQQGAAPDGYSTALQGKRAASQHDRIRTGFERAQCWKQTFLTIQVLNS